MINILHDLAGAGFLISGFGVLLFGGVAVLYGLSRRRRRHRRIVRHDKYANLTVLEMSLGESPGLRGVWVTTVLSVALPSGRTFHVRAKFEVNPERLGEVQRGEVLRARVDPLGGTFGNDYILLEDLNYLRSKSEGNARER